MDAVREKLIGMDQRYQTITNDLMDEKVFSNPALLTKLSKPSPMHCFKKFFSYWESRACTNYRINTTIWA